MKFGEIFSFEVGIQLRRYSSWIYFIVILAFVVLSVSTMVDNVEKGDYFLNSPVTIAVITSVSSMFGMLLGAAVSGSAAVRDLQTGMDPLMYTTPLRKSTYLGGRFLAALSINLAILTLIMLLLFSLSFIPELGHFFISNNPMGYLSAFTLFAIPNVFITTGILFSLAILTRKAMTAFLGAAILFFIALITMDIIAGEIGWWEVGKKLDLSGMTVLKERRLLQTPLQMQFDLVNFDSSLLVNRLLWIGIATALLTLAYFCFGFVHQAPKSRKGISIKQVATPVAMSKNWNTSVSVPADSRSFSFRNELQQAVFLTFSSFYEMIRVKVWLLIPVTATIIILISEELLEGQLGVSMVPISWKVIQLFNFFLAVKIVVAVVISFYAGELVWKERDVRLNEMADAAPVPNWVLFISKFTSLCLTLLMIQAVFVTGGIIIQIMHGY